MSTIPLSGMSPAERATVDEIQRDFPEVVHLVDDGRALAVHERFLDHFMRTWTNARMWREQLEAAFAAPPAERPSS